MDRKLLFALLASAALGLFLWNHPVLAPFKLLVVLMHETGHAAATLLVGGSVRSIVVMPNEGGLTESLIPATMLRRIIVSSGGYVGSTISGCVLLLVAARSREAKWPLVLLAGWTAAVTLLWVRDGFTLVFALAWTALLLGFARWAPALARRALLVFLATFSTLYALFDIKDDLLQLGPPRGSDADALAQLTHIPAVAWGLGWGLFSLVLLALTLRAVLRGPTPQPRQRSLRAAG
jgi:hypothetical protein